jgi:hypothetical protein
LIHGWLHAMICMHSRRWFHAYATLVHRAGVLLSLRPFYFDIVFISRSASAIPRLLRAYLVPFFDPEIFTREL